MRKRRIFPSLVVCLATLVPCGTAVLAQEYRGTLEQQMACTPDVWRLCGSEIPDVNRIVACLRTNTPQLSPGCRAVFESSADDPPRGPPPPAAPRPRQYQ